MATLLVHSCCGPCSTYTVEHFREQGHQLTALWYNPNIHPSQEHQLRLESMQRLAQIADLPLIIIPEYDFVLYLRAVAGHEAERCQHCYRLRLTRAAETARQKGFDAFSTTLLISPYQKHDLLRQTGEDVASKTGVPFIYQDLRKGFSRSRQFAKEYNLYRQQYCGCIYSEWERYSRSNKNSENNG